MTIDKPAISAMHQRFQTTRTAMTRPDTPAAEVSLEARLLQMLRRSVPPGQAREGHAEKEREIGELFAHLSLPEARTLHKRLTCGASDEPLVVAFARLVEERRGRLLAFLADARRRAAMR